METPDSVLAIFNKFKRYIFAVLPLLASIFFFQNCNNKGFQTKSSAPIEAVALASPTVVGSHVCAVPRHYVKMILPGEEKLLLCTPSSSDIMTMNINDSGRAIAKATFTFKNNNSNQIYFWANAILVGSADISGAVGDDVCPGSYSTRTTLGYGNLTPGNSQVRVTGWQGSSPCMDSQISLLSGGSLDVWVEDPDPSCVGKDIQLLSSSSLIGTSYWDWTTSMVQFISLPVPVSENRSLITVMSSVEGTPQDNPNKVCGQEAATLVAQVATNNYGVIATETNIIPASQGMGHLVLSPSQTVNYNSTVNLVSLWLGSNTGTTTIKTGGCCGDGKVGFVKQ